MKRAPKLLWVIPVVLLFAGLLKATLPQTAIGMWTSGASLSQPRSNASAVMFSDGRILITGGDDTSGPLQSAEIFATDGTMTSAAVMNVARSQHFSVTLSDGRVLVGGGVSSGGGTTNSAEVYDPSADSWTQINPMTSARANATAALLQDGRVLIASGDNSGNPSNTIEIYDPSTGTFNFGGTLFSPRTRHAMAVLSDGRVLIVGGSDGTNALASSDIFDPSSGTISAGPSLATARYGHSATTLLDGTVLITGGATTGSNGTIELASAELFDPSTGTFSTASANLVTARQGHQAFLLPNNNNVLIVGGTSGGQPIAASELFSPWQGTFAATGANITSRSAAVGSATKQDGFLLAAGGSDASGNALASTELYAFPTVKTDASDYPPGSIVTITGSGWRAGETVTLTLVESPLIDTHPVMTAIADGNGNISNNQFSPDVHDINVRFYLTAAGSQSGLQAQSTFTDAAGDTTSTTVSCSPTPVTVNTATTCTATANNIATPVTNGDPQGDVTFSFNGTGTFSPASAQCAVIQIGATNNSSCSVTLTPATVVSGNVKGNFNSADSSSWKNSVSPNFPLTVNAPTCTAPSISTQPSSQTITYGQNATFTTVAAGTPVPSVQWQVSTNGGSTWTNLTNGGVAGGATTGTLTLTAAPVSLSTNQYRAVFTNTFNGTQTANSNTATLTVNPKALTVTGIAVVDHVYDAGTTATLNFGSAALQGIVSPDVVTLNTSGYTATFASKNVANGVGVTVTGL